MTLTFQVKGQLFTDLTLPTLHFVSNEVVPVLMLYNSVGLHEGMSLVPGHIC